MVRVGKLREELQCKEKESQIAVGEVKVQVENVARELKEEKKAK